MKNSGALAIRDSRVVELDALRGIAALCVVLFHAGTLSWFSFRPGIGGYTAHLNIGVTFFFLLSGYLLFLPYAASALDDAELPDRKRYAWHRVLRILPAYWVALTLLAFWPGLVGVFTTDWWIYYGLLQSYWGAFYGGIGPAWSLSVEAAFYVVLPLLGLRLVRHCQAQAKDHRLFVLERALAGLAVTGVLMHFGLHQFRSLIYSIFAYWMWFVLGMWMATRRVALDRFGEEPGWFRWVRTHPTLLWIVAGLLYSFVALSPVFPRPFEDRPYSGTMETVKFLVYALLGLLVFIPACFPMRAGSLPDRVLSNRGLVWIGEISYGVFLWHESVLQVVQTHGGMGLLRETPLVSLLLLGLPLCLFAGWASFVLIERPGMRFAGRPVPFVELELTEG